jgi:TetR/AcrR family transcriptional repressor for divergent bdcA
VIDIKKSRPPGRPRAFDEGRALDAAGALFRARGYDGVGVAELSAAMGINPPSLYAAFGSKTGLFARALADYVDTRTAFMAAALAAPDAAAVLRTLLTGAAEAYAESGGCMAIENARCVGDPAAAAEARARLDAARAALAARLAAEAPERADRLADAATVALAGLSAAARLGWDAARLRETAEGLASALAATPAAAPTRPVPHGA